MAAYTKVTAGVEGLLEQINAGSDQWAFALAASAPATPTFSAGTTDLATGGGYTQGGTNVATTSATQSGGTFTLILATPTTWTASGGGFTFRYVLLVNKTNNLVPGYWDYGSSVTMNGSNGDTFDFTPDAVNGVFQVT